MVEGNRGQAQRWLDTHLLDRHIDEIDRDLIELIALRKAANGVNLRDAESLPCRDQDYLAHGLFRMELAGQGAEDADAQGIIATIINVHKLLQF